MSPATGKVSKAMPQATEHTMNSVPGQPDITNLGLKLILGQQDVFGFQIRVHHLQSRT